MTGRQTENKRPSMSSIFASSHMTIFFNRSVVGRLTVSDEMGDVYVVKKKRLKSRSSSKLRIFYEPPQHKQQHNIVAKEENTKPACE